MGEKIYMYTLLLGDKYKEMSGIQETAKMIVWGYQKNTRL
ncbi:hypothetical protein DJ95_4176 [Bacillus atrophaeus subsp. globigii]|uniref:Uncharacterized protein n=1 Tax=Bacillus atrophaeus (strain 1942) TaxID=720555 RepID=A0ABM5LT02_BACA1|nr:hypothetical protein BATR1942_00205 [Bacillus atrophaeus 1942]AIK45974.1 hypothetical protein DJ95_4176 [Bacillus atrophaeus subsp. globigii]EIM09566.1 hypothetical protein UY9_16816 [Bacillus atrophaeus C89]KFK84892.1 hypothetical protein DK44_3964 [Bacillus atrophaeus]GED04061.1 hypothetical protein BAT02nite_37050 [Bacillus atrophaeus]